MKQSLGAALLAVLQITGAASSRQADSNYLLWTPAHAEQVGRSTRVSGRFGDQYAFRATWLTPEVIRATARLLQISEGHNVEATDSFVQLAEAAADTVVLVELIPEGGTAPPAGVSAIFQPRGLAAGRPGQAAGRISPQLEELPGLRGVAPWDRNGHQIWIAFPLHLEDGTAVFPATVSEAELVLTMGGREARVSWPIPESLRQP